MSQFFSYVIGILVAGMIVFGLYFGMQVSSPAYARQILADEASKMTLDELEQSLIKGNPQEVAAAITEIGKGDDEIERRVRLIALASKSRDKSVKSICALSVQRMGDAVKPTVREMLESAEINEVRSACGVIRSLGKNGDEFATRLLEMLASEDEMDRHAALYGIQEMSPEVLLPGLKSVIAELDSRDFNTQCQACFVLQQMGRGALPATERLVRLVQEGNPSTRSRAAEALGAIGSVEGYDIAELIGKQLEAEAFMEKTRGLTALATLGSDANTPENLARIQYLIDNPRLNCLPESMLAMYRLTGEKAAALRVLQELLQKRDSRVAALECLGAMGEDATDAVGNIMTHLHNEELVVCETAVLALKNIGPTADAALPRLRKMLNHKDFLMAVATQEAIDAITQKKTTD